MSGPVYIDESKLPTVVRVGKLGFVLSILGLGIGGSIVRVIDAFLPGIKGNGLPPWGWPVLIAIWTPGVVGFVLSFYSIARFPYLNLVTGGGPNIAMTSRWIWVSLGCVFYVLAPLIAAAACVNPEPVATLIMLLFAIEMLFVGFLLTSYRKERHPTIATFLELTFGIGIVLFPIYIPTLVISSIRCRRFLKSLQSATA